MPRALRTGCLVVLCTFAALALGAVFGWRAVLERAGNWLVLDQPPVPSDAVVAVSGLEWRRRTALDLYQRGLAPLVVFSVSDTSYYFGRAIDPAASSLEEAHRRGIPADSILVNRDISSTWEDALASRATAGARGLRSLIVVSSPLTMRRVALTYKHVFRGSQVSLCFVSVPLKTEKLSLDAWWTRERELQEVNNEYLKLVLYYFKYLRHAPPPDP